MQRLNALSGDPGETTVHRDEGLTTASGDALTVSSSDERALTERDEGEVAVVVTDAAPLDPGGADPVEGLREADRKGRGLNRHGEDLSFTWCERPLLDRIT